MLINSIKGEAIQQSNPIQSNIYIYIGDIIICCVLSYILLVLFSGVRYTQWGATVANSELYDYVAYPDETVNLIGYDSYKSTKQTMRSVLNDGWYKAKV